MTDTRATAHLYPAHDLAICTDANTAVERITAIYERSAQTIRDRFLAFARGEDCSEDGSACYPYLGITVDPKTLVSDARPAWGTVAYPGVYGTTLTRPDLFREYYRTQIERLLHYHNSPVVVGVSNRPIPLPFVVEASTVDITPEQARALGGAFTLPDLAQIDDSIANGTFRPEGDEPQPLSMFTAERVDLALQRHHLSGQLGQPAVLDIEPFVRGEDAAALLERSGRRALQRELLRDLSRRVAPRRLGAADTA